MQREAVLYSVEEGLSWDQALLEFASYQSSGGLSAKTIENREQCLRLLERMSGRLPLEVDVSDLRAQLTRAHARTGESLAPGTMRSERSYFQTFYTWLVEEDYLDKSPAARLRKIKMARRKPRPFRLEQVEAIIDSGAYTRTRDLVTIAALTGLRLGEVVKLRGEDVDPQGMVLSSLRKGGLDHRLAVAPVLAEIIARYPRKGWWFPSPYRNKLFPHGDGHILMASASSAITQAIRRAGITDKKLTAHSLRHFYGTTLLAAGVPIRVIQELMGHASLATTQLYTEVNDDDMQAGVAPLPMIDRRAHSARRARIAA